MTRAERIEAALVELVALKDIKDRLDHPSIADLDRGQLPAMRRAYESRKPIAWSEARAALALPEKSQRADGMPVSADERHLRRLLCSSQSSLAYMDDGEASDCSVEPHIDFMRESVDSIEAKLQERAIEKLRGLALPEEPVVRDGEAERLIRLRKNAGNMEYEAQCEAWLAAQSAPVAPETPEERIAAIGKRIDDKLANFLVPAPAPRAPVLLTEEQIDALRGLDTTKRVRFYEHDFYVLSNFSAFSLLYRGLSFATSEHAYHWEKFTGGTFPDIAAQCRFANSAHEAFKIAERNKAWRRPDWDEVKVEIMRGILRAKADQHEYVRRKLLATGDRELAEDSWRDDFWGWGPNRDGKNMLGRLWMKIRAELREQASLAANAIAPGAESAK